jgi:hypothetical protein
MNRISLNFGESTGLLKLDVESLGFIGQAPNFACQGSALGLAIGGRSRLQEAESAVIVVREGKNLKGWCSAWCSEPSAGAFWKRRLKTPSKPSKPGRARRERQAHHEPGI